MSVPLDRLYHYLGDCVNHDLLIYRWAPHGSRKLEDLVPLLCYTAQEYNTKAPMICHDQEPLNWQFYSRQDIIQATYARILPVSSLNFLTHPVLLDYQANFHLRSVIVCGTCFDKTLLLHSELHSANLEIYQKHDFVPVYIWSHAIIALDWFRYAQHDPALMHDTIPIQKTFLVYNRAWRGTREYRLYFAQQLVAHDLTRHTQMSFAAVDNNTHYVDHVFANKKFQIHMQNLEQFYSINTADSNSSADYCSKDYAACGIEVVLETLFDDDRWHLTEKTLRPIACGKPFLLMATPGSLQYLRDYGFETFADVIDESYDTIANSQDRLNAVVQEMKRIAALDADAKQVLYTKLHEIAQRNKQRFFNGLFNQVIEEYRANLDHAMSIMQQHCTDRHRTAIRQLLQQN
jgi:hypothetical protein